MPTRDGTQYFFNIDYTPLNYLKAAILNGTGKTLETLPAPKHKPLARTGVSDIIKATINNILEMELPTRKKVSLRKLLYISFLLNP